MKPGTLVRFVGTGSKAIEVQDLQVGDVGVLTQRITSHRKFVDVTWFRVGDTIPMYPEEFEEIT